MSLSSATMTNPNPRIHQSTLSFHKTSRLRRVSKMTQTTLWWKSTCQCQGHVEIDIKNTFADRPQLGQYIRSQTMIVAIKMDRKEEPRNINYTNRPTFNNKNMKCTHKTAFLTLFRIKSQITKIVSLNRTITACTTNLTLTGHLNAKVCTLLMMLPKLDNNLGRLVGSSK